MEGGDGRDGGGDDLGKRAGDVAVRVLKSESSFSQSLQMIQHLFLEPVAPLDPRIARDVFASTQPIVDCHTLLWQRLEPLVGATEAGVGLDTLAEVARALYDSSAFFPVYISFFTTHDAAQHHLKVLLAASPRFGQLSRDASLLRPGTSIVSCLQLMRVRPWQLRRLCLQAAGILAEAGPQYRPALFAARGAARQLLQVTEICRLEHLEKDQRFLAELCASFASPPAGFFGPDSSVLWKGYVQLGLDGDCRLVVCNDRMMLLRKSTSFWSSLPYQLVGKWHSGMSPIRASFFSAREVGASSGAGPTLFGVHLSSVDGTVDWRLILKDRLASSVLMTAVKEMTFGEETGRYNVTLALEDEDVWRESDGAEPIRDYLGRSPEELQLILRELRAQYEREGAVVLESRASRVFNFLGREAWLGILVPRAPMLANEVSQTEFVSSCVSAVLYREGSSWVDNWRILFREHMERSRADTLMRDNVGIVLFSVQYMTAHARPWVLAMLGEAMDNLPFAEQCDYLANAIMSRHANPMPSKVRWMLDEVRIMVAGCAQLVPFVARGVGALLLLRVVGAIASQQGSCFRVVSSLPF